MVNPTPPHWRLVDEHSPYPIITDVGALLRIAHTNIYLLSFYRWEEALALFLTISFLWEWY